jgi:CheY-like chemotaxis protein
MNTIIDYLKYPVLFVDDDESNRVIFQANFGDDFNIILAKDGHEALKLLYDISPAVLVTDQRMPGMTGVELAEIVRRDKPEVVRMIITAYADIQAAIDAINRAKFCAISASLGMCRKYGLTCEIPLSCITSIIACKSFKHRCCAPNEWLPGFGGHQHCS